MPYAASNITCICLQVADSKTVWGLYKEGCTLQVHQPQRYCDKLAGICSGLEQRLGCLVGINAHIMPAGTQVISATLLVLISQFWEGYRVKVIAIKFPVVFLLISASVLLRKRSYKSHLQWPGAAAGLPGGNQCLRYTC